MRRCLAVSALVALVTVAALIAVGAQSAQRVYLYGSPVLLPGGELRPGCMVVGTIMVPFSEGYQGIGVEVSQPIEYMGDSYSYILAAAWYDGYHWCYGVWLAKPLVGDELSANFYRIITQYAIAGEKHSVKVLYDGSYVYIYIDRSEVATFRVTGPVRAVAYGTTDVRVVCPSSPSTGAWTLAAIGAGIIAIVVACAALALHHHRRAPR